LIPGSDTNYLQNEILNIGNRCYALKERHMGMAAECGKLKSALSHSKAEYACMKIHHSQAFGC
jgi:hypothetical protein